MSTLDELEALAKAAAVMEETWKPYTYDDEGGGKGATPRLHQLQDAEMCVDIDAEEAAADADAAFIAAANPTTILSMVEVIRAAHSMRFLLPDETFAAKAFDAALAKLEDSKQ